MALASWTFTASADVGSWGVGTFVNYDVPTLGLADWYGNATKWGITGSFVPLENVTVEVEYHRASFNDPKLETATFTWTDGANYVSPDAKSSMTYNSLLVNGLVKWTQRGEPFRASSFAPYIAVGSGFYRYKNHVSGLLWPGQKDALVTKMEPFTDQRFALGFNAGLGIEAFVVDNVAVDLRARYNMVIGELRPMEDWGIQEAFTLQAVDLGAGLKVYFGGK